MATQLAVIVCQEQGPLRTFVLHPNRTRWMGSINNVISEESGSFRVHRSSCLVNLGENSAMLIDSINQKAYSAQDLLKGKWNHLEAPKIRRSGATGIKVDERVFLIGGSDGTALAKVECFDLKGRTWSSSMPMPMPIAAWNPTTVCGSHHKLLIMGRSEMEKSSTRCIQILDNIEQWRTVDGVFSESGSVIGACEFQGRILLCTEKNTMFLDWDAASSAFTTETTAQSPGACDSMTTWDNVVAVAHKKRVWILEPQQNRITELPTLPLGHGWKRSFVAVLSRREP